jgi:hypothetical protein
VAEPVTSATPRDHYPRPATAIWPWLVQLGQNRGELYSYSGWRTWPGCKIRDTDRIIPDSSTCRPATRSSH